MGTRPSGDATLCGTGGAPGDGGCSPPAPIPTACTPVCPPCTLLAHITPLHSPSPPCLSLVRPGPPACTHPAPLLHPFRAPTPHPLHPSCTLHLFCAPILPPCTPHPLHVPIPASCIILTPPSTPLRPTPIPCTHPAPCSPPAPILHPLPLLCTPPAPILRPAHEMQCAAVITQPGAMRVPPQVWRKVPSRSYCSEICSGGHGVERGHVTHWVSPPRPRPHPRAAHLPGPAVGHRILPVHHP